MRAWWTACTRLPLCVDWLEPHIARGEVVADKEVEGVVGPVKQEEYLASYLVCLCACVYPGYEDPAAYLVCLGPDILRVVPNHTPSAMISN